MEMNDNEYLVQKVNGPIGGFSMVLDAQTADYLPSTVRLLLANLDHQILLFRVKLQLMYPVIKQASDNNTQCFSQIRGLE